MSLPPVRVSWLFPAHLWPRKLSRMFAQLPFYCFWESPWPLNPVIFSVCTPQPELEENAVCRCVNEAFVDAGLIPAVFSSCVFRVWPARWHTWGNCLYMTRQFHHGASSDWNFTHPHAQAGLPETAPPSGCRNNDRSQQEVRWPM